MTNQHHKTEAHVDDDAADTRVVVGRHACRIICVDDVVPQHVVESRRHARPRLVYAQGELAHFEMGEHRYALVLDETAQQAAGAPRENLHDLLTNREMQIVQFICLGYLTKQIADRLHLSEFTVRSYLKTIYCKLGVRSRAAMVFRYTQAFGTVKAD